MVYYKGLLAQHRVQNKTSQNPKKSPSAFF
jgi:hypothetical protein